MSTLTYKIAAKTNVGMVRSNNEDNFIVNPDLTTEEWFCSNDENIYDLGTSGLLLAVADGMGGAEAGELASKLAVDAVRNYFNEFISSNSGKLTDEKISEALVEVLHQANKSIIDRTREEPETRGMGTTMILGWLYESTMHVGWIGDSRAYLVREGMPLQPASRDHSFVQDLVNAGKLSYSDSFYHPDSNIITQSLGNPDHDLKPEVYRFDVGKGDLVLLCSDGLNGMLTDEYLDGLLRDHRQDPLVDIADLLISNANEAGGADNITVGLITVENAPRNLAGVAIPPLDGSAEERTYSLGGTMPDGDVNFDFSKGEETESKPAGGKTRKLLYLTIFLLLAALGVIAWLVMRDQGTPEPPPKVEEGIDKEPVNKDSTNVLSVGNSSEIDDGGEDDSAAEEDAEETPQREPTRQQTPQNGARPQDAGQGTEERGGPSPEPPPEEESVGEGGSDGSSLTQIVEDFTNANTAAEGTAPATPPAPANNSGGQSPPNRVVPNENTGSTGAPPLDGEPIGIAVPADIKLWQVEIRGKDIGIGEQFYIPLSDYHTYLREFRHSPRVEIPDGGELSVDAFPNELVITNFISKEEAKVFVGFLKGKLQNSSLFSGEEGWYVISEMQQ